MACYNGSGTLVRLCTDSEVEHVFGFLAHAGVNSDNLDEVNLCNEQPTAQMGFNIGFKTQDEQAFSAELSLFDASAVIEQCASEGAQVKSSGPLARNLIRAAITQNRYCKFNLSIPPAKKEQSNIHKFVEMQRKSEDFKLLHMATDLCKSTLVLLGGAGCRTRFHIDWSEAHNYAFGVLAVGILQHYCLLDFEKVLMCK